MCNCKCTECDCCNKQNTSISNEEYDKHIQYLEDCDLLNRIENHGVMYSTDYGSDGCKRIVGKW